MRVAIVAVAVLAIGVGVYAFAGRPSAHEPPTPAAQVPVPGEDELQRVPPAIRPFVVRVNSICRASLARRGKVGVATDARGVARVAEALLPVYGYRRRELAKIRPPHSRRKLYAALLMQVRVAERRLLAAQAAGRKGDFKEADFELRLFTGAQSTAEFFAEQLRLEACAERE